MRAYTNGPLGQIHYQIFGDGKPLILCHQAPTCSVQFLSVFESLANNGFRVLAVDNPGFGMSDGPKQPARIECEYLDALMTVMDSLDIDSAHIAGHHTGSMLALEAANQYPHRFDKVVLHGPLLLDAQERMQWHEGMVPREKEMAIPKLDGSHLISTWEWRRGYAAKIESLAAANRHVLWQMLAGDHSWYGHDACYHYDQVSALEQLEHPCLVLTNTGDLVHEVACRIATIRPDLELIQFDGGTFDFIDEYPDQWVAAVTGYLMS